VPGLVGVAAGPLLERREYLGLLMQQLEEAVLPTRD
jgi:hypothetical protein